MALEDSVQIEYMTAITSTTLPLALLPSPVGVKISAKVLYTVKTQPRRTQISRRKETLTQRRVLKSQD